MPLAIFDLDNTLIGGDSDYLWGEYLGEIGVVDPKAHARENDRYYQDYLAGYLDIFAFLRFQLRPLAEHPLEQLESWRRDYLERKIRPILLPKAKALVQEHAGRGDTLLIITATNSFITAPIARLLGVDNLIATEAEMVDAHYTGKVAGTPSFAAGKVSRLQTWMSERDMDLSGSSFYSDSHNDLPLLEKVSYPVAVDADPKLTGVARERGWPQLSLRETN